MGLCCQPSACGCKINFLFNSGRAQQSENAPECSRRTGRTCDIEVVTLRRAPQGGGARRGARL